MDFLLLFSSVGLGILAGFLYSTIDRDKKKSNHLKNDVVTQNQNYKKELESVKVEKAITDGSITRVYEAFHNGKIAKLEFDRLISKYDEELVMYNDRIKQLQPLADYDELQNVRGNLVTVFEERLMEIDRRLLDISKKDKQNTDSHEIEVEIGRNVHLKNADAGMLGSRTLKLLGEEKQELKKMEGDILDALNKLDNMAEENVTEVSNNSQSDELDAKSKDQRKRDALGNLL